MVGFAHMTEKNRRIASPSFVNFSYYFTNKKGICQFFLPCVRSRSLGGQYLPPHRNGIYGSAYLKVKLIPAKFSQFSPHLEIRGYYTPRFGDIYVLTQIPLSSDLFAARSNSHSSDFPHTAHLEFKVG